MKKTVLILTVLFAVAFIGNAMAVPPGKTLIFKGGPMGKIHFSGKIHADAKNKCMDCHPKIFKMKKGSMKVKAPHKPGEWCGNCHDGKKAFAQTPENCKKCHGNKAPGY